MRCARSDSLAGSHSGSAHPCGAETSHLQQVGACVFTSCSLYWSAIRKLLSPCPSGISQSVVTQVRLRHGQPCRDRIRRKGCNLCKYPGWGTQWAMCADFSSIPPSWGGAGPLQNGVLGSDLQGQSFLYDRVQDRKAG